MKKILLAYFVILVFSCTEERPYQIGLLGKSITKKYDPVKTNDYSYDTLLSQTCGRLTSLSRNISIEGDLALSWEVEENKKYTFKLDRSRKFFNGESFSSIDVKHTFDNLKVTRKSEWKILASIEMIDESTVVFNLKNKSNSFLYKISRAAACIQSKKNPYVNVDGIEVPNSNGAYEIINVKKNKITLKANKFFGQTQIEETIIVNFLNQSDAINLFNKGKLHDLSFYLLNKNEIKSLRRPKLISSKLYWTWVIILNFNSDLFQKQKNRQYFLQSIDMNRLRNNWGATIIPGEDLIPKGMRGHQERSYPTRKKLFDCNGRMLKVAILKGIQNDVKLAEGLKVEILKMNNCKVKISLIPMGRWTEIVQEKKHDIIVHGIGSTSTDSITFYRHFLPKGVLNFFDYKKQNLKKNYELIVKLNYKKRDQNSYDALFKSFIDMGNGRSLGYPFHDFAYSKEVKRAYMHPFGMHQVKW